MATSNVTSRTIRDLLWEIRTRREAERDSRIDDLRERYEAATDALLARDAFTREIIDGVHRSYTFTGQASGAQAVVLYDSERDSYAVTFNQTRFLDTEVIEAVIAVRIEFKLRAVARGGQGK